MKQGGKKKSFGVVNYNIQWEKKAFFEDMISANDWKHKCSDVEAQSLLGIMYLWLHQHKIINDPFVFENVIMGQI